MITNPLRAFTADEAAELQAHPVGSPMDDLTEARFVLRRGMAQLVCENLVTHPSTPDWARAVYRQVPPWQFYTSNGLRRRVYGVYSDDRVHAATAHVMWINQVIDGVPVADLTPMDRWPPDDLAFFQLMTPEQRGIFLDPSALWPLPTTHSTFMGLQVKPARYDIDKGVGRKRCHDTEHDHVSVRRKRIPTGQQRQGDKNKEGKYRY